MTMINWKHIIYVSFCLLLHQAGSWKEYIPHNQTALLITLSNGSLDISHPSGHKMKTLHCSSWYSSCSDDKWHQFSISFTQNLVNIRVDNINFKLDSIGTFEVDVPQRYTFGGMPNSRSNGIYQLGNMPGFAGCITQIFYKASMSEVDLIDLVPSHDSANSAAIGQIDLSSQVAVLGTCPSSFHISAKSHSNPPSMVTFSRPGGYIVTSYGWKTVSTGNITFKMRTFIQNALLFFSDSGWPNKVAPKQLRHRENNLIQPIDPVDRFTGKDIFSAELREGYLVFLLNTGSGINDFATDDIWRGPQLKSSWYVADGKTHSVEVRLNNGSLQVVVDGQERNMRPARQPKYTILNLNGYLYIGGLPESVRQDAPAQVLSASLRNDYIGCLSDLNIDNFPVDLRLEATAVWARGHIRTGNLCQGEGVCSTASTVCGPGRCLPESWIHPICDCSDTIYTGETCNGDGRILTFNGFQGIGVRLSLLPRPSETESLVLRFQTFQKDALLFKSSSRFSTAPDQFGVQLSNSRIVVFYNLGVQTKKYVTTSIDSSRSWHTLRVLRRSRRLDVTVDNATFTYIIADEVNILDCDFARFGVLLLDDITQLAVKQTSDAFIGRLAQFQLNGLDILQLMSGHFNSALPAGHISAKSLLEIWKQRIEVTATKDSGEHIHQFPVQFKSVGGVIEIPIVNHGRQGCLNVAFSIKTETGFGLLALLLAPNDEFIGLELLRGQIHLRYKLESVRGHSFAHEAPFVNDTQWHSIQLKTCTQVKFQLSVTIDNKTHIPSGLSNGPSVSSSTFIKSLFLGGYGDLLNENIRTQFESHYPYEGCLADLDVTYGPNSEFVGTPPNFEIRHTSPPINPLHYSQMSPDILPGCSPLDTSLGGKEMAQTRCRPGNCGYGGRCIQQLSSTFCDCSLSGFAGHDCTDLATVIKFSSPEEPGCAVFEFSPMRNNSRDTIVFGVQTSTKSPTTLLYITSSNKSLDFLKVELIPQKTSTILRLTFNMGSGVQIVEETRFDMSDGIYRVVRVIRDNAKLTIQVDSEEPKEYVSRGSGASHFNDIHQVFVGCTPTNVAPNSPISPASHFTGYVAGVNYNGIPMTSLLLGETFTGVFLKRATGILIDPSFRPQLQKKTNLPANDMGAEQYPSKFSDHMGPVAPLVVAKPNCFEADQSFLGKSSTCKPQIPNGIVVPRWNLSPLQVKATDVPRDSVFDQAGNTVGQYKPGVPAADSERIFPTEQDDAFRAWNSHDKATQDDGPRFLGKYDNTLNLVETSSFNVTVNPLLPFLKFWLLIGGCCAALILMSLLMIYGVYKVRRRNAGSYNVEENRNFVNRGSTTNFLSHQPPPGSTVVNNGTELNIITPGDAESAQSPTKEWYV